MNQPLESARTGSLRSATRRLLMNAVAWALVYGNAAVALQPPRVRRELPHLPCPAFVTDAFLMTGMFNSYSLYNLDLFIAGERTQLGAVADRGHWTQISVREHFTQRQGVTFTQLFSAHEWDMHGVPAQERSWRFLARRIREHHNRLHPEQTIARVGFGSYEWPQSPVGYRALKRAPMVSSQTWFVEPDKP